MIQSGNPFWKASRRQPRMIAVKSYKEFTTQQRRYLLIGLLGLFSWFVSICLWGWSSITHQHVSAWTIQGFDILGFLGASYMTWGRYHDPNTPFK